MSKKNISRIIFGTILLGFFLPFVTVTFLVKVTLNGYKLVLGDNGYYMVSNTSAVFSLLAAIGGLAVSFMKVKKAEILAAGASVIGIIALFSLGAKLTEGPTGYMVDLQFGLYMNVLLFAAAGLVNILSIRETSEGKLSDIFAPEAKSDPIPVAEPRKEAIPQILQPISLTPFLQGITGQYSGQTFTFEGKKLILGRDANKCNITFAHDTPEISRVHCEVSFDETSKSFILQDNGSSFGTFLATGDKLNIGQPYSITNGSRFYMANKGNMFEVSF